MDHQELTILGHFWMNIIAIAGLVFTVAGFAVSIILILKTRKIAEAARNAAMEAQNNIRRNVMLSDISSCEKTVNEVKTFIRDKKYESGLIRTSDLISQLIRLRSFAQRSLESEEGEFQDSISQLAIIRDLLERKMIDGAKEIDRKTINTKLSVIADRLNNWIGRSKYTITKGE